MHALLVSLSSRGGCYTSGPSTVFSPQCQIGEVFQHVTALAVDGSDLTIVDSAASGATFRLTPQTGELVKLVQD